MGTKQLVPSGVASDAEWRYGKQRQAHHIVSLELRFDHPLLDRVDFIRARLNDGVAPRTGTVYARLGAEVDGPSLQPLKDSLRAGAAAR
jgi:hypothetical protein